MIQRFKNLATLAWNSLWNQLGVFAMTNKNFATGDAAFIPACHAELELTLAGGTVTSAIQNTGIAGLKWIRVRFNLKTLGGLAATNQVVVSIQAGTGAAVTAPEQIAQVVRRMETGDLTLNGEGFGASQNGFQSYKVIITSLTTAGAAAATTAVLDVLIDAG